MNKKKIVILGAGISGLATAFWLNKKGFDVTILEAQSQVGGAMQTNCEDGFLIDFGPNSGLETTPLIRQIVEEVGLLDEMIYANEASSKRYIRRNEKLHALTMGLSPFLKTKLFSIKGKLRLFGEPFIGKSADAKLKPTLGLYNSTKKSLVNGIFTEDKNGALTYTLPTTGRYYILFLSANLHYGAELAQPFEYSLSVTME